MKRYLFRIIVATLTFGCGVATTSVWTGEKSSPAYRATCADWGGASLTPLTLPADFNSGAANSLRQETERDDTRVEDRYYNYNYGFSVDLPKGMIGVRSPAPMPNHGFVIDLENPQASKSDRNSSSTLSVEASYNSAMWESFDDAIKDELNWVSEGGNRIKSLSKIPICLAGLRAMRFVQVYENNRGLAINDVTLAFRKEHGEEVIYTIYLNTPLSRYEQDKSAVVYLQKTWCLQPLP
jgi:hypothetical protein